MPPEPARVAEARAWFTKAARDLRAAEVLLAAVPPFRGGGVPLPAGAEKAMKGFLSWQDRPFGKTHDLAVIGGLAPRMTRVSSRSAGGRAAERLRMGVPLPRGS